MKTLFKYIILIFFICINVIAYSEDNTEKNFDVNKLFEKLEQKTDSINSVLIDVKIYDKISTTTAELTIKSPDKFAIIFTDGSNKIFFDGNTLWIYIDTYKEAYYHTFSEKTTSMFGSAFTFINPSSILKRLTKTTLFAFFELQPAGIEKKDKEKFFIIKFIPRFEGLIKKVFTVGSYDVYFSETTALPVKIIEYDNEGKTKNTLEVLKYKLNNEISDTFFEYIKPVNVTTMPILTVIADKIEFYYEDLATRVVNFIGF